MVTPALIVAAATVLACSLSAVVRAVVAVVIGLGLFGVGAAGVALSAAGGAPWWWIPAGVVVALCGGAVGHAGMDALEGPAGW